MKALIGLLSLLICVSAQAEEAAPSPSPSQTPVAAPIAVAAPVAAAVPVAEPAPEPRKQRIYISGLAGKAVAIGDDEGQLTTFAGRVGLGYLGTSKVIPYLGVYVGYMSDSIKVSGVTGEMQLVAVMGESLIRHVFGTPFYVGGRFGMSIVDVTVSNATTSLKFSGSSLTMGPALGADLEINEHVLINGDLSVLLREKFNLKGASTIVIPIEESVEVQLQAGVSFRL